MIASPALYIFKVTKSHKIIFIHQQMHLTRRVIYYVQPLRDKKIWLTTLHPDIKNLSFNLHSFIMSECLHDCNNNLSKKVISFIFAFIWSSVFVLGGNKSGVTTTEAHLKSSHNLISCLCISYNTISYITTIFTTLTSFNPICTPFSILWYHLQFNKLISDLSFIK